jgi:hypothetical protein
VRAAAGSDETGCRHVLQAAQVELLPAEQPAPHAPKCPICQPPWRSSLRPVASFDGLIATASAGLRHLALRKGRELWEGLAVFAP